MSQYPEDKHSTYKEGIWKLKDQLKRIKNKYFRHNFKVYQREMTWTIVSDKQPKQLKQLTQRIPSIRNVCQTLDRRHKEIANTFAGNLEITLKPIEFPQNENMEQKSKSAERTATNDITNQISHTKGNSKHNKRRSQPKESPWI
jgi:hypothetical protein